MRVAMEQLICETKAALFEEPVDFNDHLQADSLFRIE